MESSIAVFLMRQLACEQLPTVHKLATYFLYRYPPRPCAWSCTILQYRGAVSPFCFSAPLSPPTCKHACELSTGGSSCGCERAPSSHQLGPPRKRRV